MPWTLPRTNSRSRAPATREKSPPLHRDQATLPDGKPRLGIQAEGRARVSHGRYPEAGRDAQSDAQHRQQGGPGRPYRPKTAHHHGEDHGDRPPCAQQRRLPRRERSTKIGSAQKRTAADVDGLADGQLKERGPEGQPNAYGHGRDSKQFVTMRLFTNVTARHAQPSHEWSHVWRPGITDSRHRAERGPISPRSRTDDESRRNASRPIGATDQFASRRRRAASMRQQCRRPHPPTNPTAGPITKAPDQKVLTQEPIGA